MSALGQELAWDVDSLPDSDNHDDDDNEDKETGSSSAKEKMELAKKETLAVFRLRFIVFIVLLLAAIVVVVIVFYVTAGAEDEEFQSQYEGASDKVLQAFIDIVDSKLAAVSSLGVAAIAHGIDHRNNGTRTRTWPFVTLSRFQQRSAAARDQSGSLFVHINPMVYASDRQEWEEFVVGEDASWM
jgi:uncharacterized membrane protein